MAAPGNPWVLAARPQTLWVAVSAVLVGSALAVHDGAFRLDVFLLTMGAALLIQVGVNYANDYSDGVRGTDTAERIGPRRAVASGLIAPGRMRAGIVAVFGAAAVLGAILAFISGPWVIAIGAASILAALGYTGGPRPYGYAGLGELSVFIFFGPVATVGTRYVYDGAVTAAAWVGAVMIGLLSTAILVANNLRDIGTDTAAGKNTLAVRLGPARTRTLYTATVYGAFAATAVGAAARWSPPWTALALLALPLAVVAVRIVTTAADGPTFIKGLVATARLQILTAALFSLGAIV